MDPALRELLRSQDPGEGRMVEAIIRLRRPGLDVPGVRIVSRFGTIVTCRLPAESVPEVRRYRDVISLKAPRTLGPELDKSNPTSGLRDTTIRRHTDRRRPPGLALTGSGVVCGFADWGMDFDHPNFKRPDGTTRLLTLWDQRDQVGGARAEPYGYGVIHSRDRINEALRGARPYDALGYRPTGADHGTHVADIAAGNGSAGGPVGIAPEADLVFVHLADRGTGGLSDLGDSRRLLEAVDFIAHAAGVRPWVINVSVGRMGGSHDGCSPCELAFDELLGAAPGRFIVQSAGNYRRAGTHTSGLLTRGGAQTFTLVTNPADTTANELEVWYDGDDIFTVRIESPTGATVTVALDDEADLYSHGQVAGRVYHRACDPNNGDNHIDAFLYPWAPPGRWQVTLHAERARHGRFDAWIERDEECGPCQARFAESDRNRLGTTGTIANGHLPLVVGAHDAHSRARAVAGFSSVGPTRDGRAKPDLVAPGMAVLAARAEPEAGSRSRGLLMRKSGTSMAAPHVTGAVALCLQAGGHRLGAKQIRDLVLGSVDSGGPRDRTLALGRGRLNISRLCADLHRTYPIGNPYEHWEPVMDAAEFDARLPLAAMPSSAYRELLYRPTGDIARWIRQRFDTVARPGEAPAEAPQPGDLVLTVALGRPGVGECVVLAGAGLTRRARDGQQGSGWYGKVTSPTSAAGPHEYRILDAAGRTPPGRLLLRRHSDFGGVAEFDAESPPAVPVDTAAAVPPFNTAERAIVLEPLLTPTQSAAAVAWSTRMHPTTSGVTLDDIGGALTNYVDATAVQAAIVRRNTQDPAHRIDASAPLAVPVIVECVHQFQRKCYLDLNQHDGQAGESTLDSLGLIARTGPGMRGARRRHDGAQQRLNARDRAVQAATANEFSAANWFDRMTDPSVFGLTTKLGFGLHLVLVRKLRQAERFLLTLPAFRGMTPARLGSALGLTEKHGGARPTDATTTSLHSLGLAIDISFLANPWVRRDASWQALTRAASLITGTNLTKGSAGAYLSGLGTDPARSTGQVWDELDQRNAELIGYLGLDGPALRAMLFDRAQGWATTVLNPGETLDQAVRRWRNSIRDDTRRLQAGDFKGHESPAKGFLTHPRDLAIALREHGCLAWGGVDSGPPSTGAVT